MQGSLVYGVWFWFCKYPPNQASLNYQETLLCSRDRWSYFNPQDQAMMKSMQFSWSGVAWIRCNHRSPPLWCIRLYCLAPLPCRQWWIWFISMVASSVHSHSAGWQWQTGAGSPHICLVNTAEREKGEAVVVAAESLCRHLTSAFLIWGLQLTLNSPFTILSFLYSEYIKIPSSDLMAPIQTTFQEPSFLKTL